LRRIGTALTLDLGETNASEILVACSNLSSATHKMEDHDNQCNHEQQMDEVPCDVKGKSSAPKEQKDKGDDQEHAPESSLGT